MSLLAYLSIRNPEGIEESMELRTRRMRRSAGTGRCARMASSTSSGSVASESGMMGAVNATCGGVRGKARGRRARVCASLCFRPR
jgi:hypothetical protein